MCSGRYRRTVNSGRGRWPAWGIGWRCLVKPSPTRGGGARLTFRTVVDDNGEEHVIIEWAYKDGTFDWYGYKKGEADVE